MGGIELSQGCLSHRWRTQSVHDRQVLPHHSGQANGKVRSHSLEYNGIRQRFRVPITQ